MSTPSLRDMFRRLWLAEGQYHSARTVEAFGWLVLIEGCVLVLVPQLAVAALHLPALAPQAGNYLRLAGVLVAGVGMLYVVSGRLNALGFVFASLLDRPLVPPLMLVLWWLDIVPGPLAAAFALQDFASFLWTLRAWRSEQHTTASR